MKDRRENPFNELEKLFGKYGSTVVWSLFLSLVFAIWLGWTALAQARSAEELAINTLLLILGFFLGWLIGIYATPYDDKEASRFVTLGQAVSAFLSGYAFSKLDRYLEQTLFQDASHPVFDHWIKLGYFAAALLIGFLVVFTSRAYFRREFAPAHPAPPGSGGS